MHDDLLELTHDQLARVSGGFLPLLGLLGAGASIGSQIMGAVGQKKAQKAQQELAAAEADAARAGGGGGAPPGQALAQGMSPQLGPQLSDGKASISTSVVIVG